MHPTPAGCADLRWTDADIDGWLQQAAELWIRLHADEINVKQKYVPTTENAFLYRAESAFGAAYKRMLAELPPPPPPPPNDGFHLYRLWAADGRLLYVGVSTRLRNRLRAHRRRWGDLIADVTWEDHVDAASMLAAEAAAVRDEMPALNKALIG